MRNKVYTPLKDDEKRTGQELLTAEKMLLKKHPMRRKKQLLPEAECQQILDDATSGVLSLLSDDGYPYGVPLSHVRKGDKLYFHCAKPAISWKLSKIRTKLLLRSLLRIRSWRKNIQLIFAV